LGSKFGRPLSFSDALAEEVKALAKGSSLPLPFSLVDALAEEAKALAEGSSLLLAGTGGVLIKELLAVGSLVPLGSLIGDGLCMCGSRLSTLLHCLQRTRATFLFLLHAGKFDLMLQSLRGLASEPGKEALAAEPQEDDSGGRRLPCLSDASATSRLLVKEALATCSLPLTFEGGALAKKTLRAASSCWRARTVCLSRSRWRWAGSSWRARAACSMRSASYSSSHRSLMAAFQSM